MNIIEPQIIRGVFSGAGGRLVLYPVSTTQTVSVGILVGAGSLTEEDSCIGYSHFLEHMLFKGTGKLDFEELNREFEKYGAYVNAFTGRYYTLYYFHCLAEFIHPCLDLLLEILFQSILPLEEIKKEQKVILEEISSYQDNPEDYLWEEFYKGTFQGSFFGNPILGEVPNIKSITREKLLTYYHKYYIPHNMIISIAGKFSQQNLLKQLQAFSTAPSPPFMEDSPLPRADIPFHVQHQNHRRADLEQAYVSFGLRLDAPSGSKQVMKLFNAILGGMSSSRLYTEIREKLALCYDIDSSLYADPNINFLSISASTQKDKLSELLDALQLQVESFLKKPISEQELTIAKNQLKSRLIFRQENISQTMLRMASQIFFHGRIASDQRIFEKLEQIRLQDFAPLYECLRSHKASVHTLTNKY